MLNPFLLYTELKLFGLSCGFPVRMLVTLHNCVLKQEKGDFRCDPVDCVLLLISDKYEEVCAASSELPEGDSELPSIHLPVR